MLPQPFPSDLFPPPREPLSPPASFTRTGPAGPEQVLVYVFNGGGSLYRLVCISQPEGRAKYAPVFGHMAATLKVAPSAQ